MNMQWTISLLAALIAAPLCLADVIHVPADEDTIQEGIDAASNGDTVIVADDDYAEAGNYNLTISGKTITVRSASGSPGCKIICPGANSTFGFQITSNSSTIRGFTIVNGTAGQSGDGGAMRCSGGSPKIISCVFEDNSAPVGGGAVSCVSGTTATFLACSFIENSTSTAIGKGGAVWVDAASPTFVNCLLLGNQAATHGAGIHGKSSADITLVNCTLAANELEAGTGVEGTAVSLAGSELTMTNGIVWDNVGPAGADVLYADGTSTQTVSYSDVQVVVSGTGNISDDPLFVTETLTGTSADNLRLQAASPCINIDGGGGAVPADASDVDGDSDTTEDTPDLDWDERVQYDLLDMGCYEHRCTGDVESDCLVDGDDFTGFMAGLSDWSGEGEYAPCPAYSAADVNRDCMVNIDDLILFFASWGECPNGCGKPVYPGGPTFTGLAADTWHRTFGTPSSGLLVKLYSVQGGTEVGDFQVKGTFGTNNELLLRNNGDGQESDKLHTLPATGLTVDVTVTPTPTAGGALGAEDDMPPYGFDVTYVVTNTTSGYLELPTFSIPGIQLDATLTGYDLSHGAHFVAPSVGGGSTWTESNTYPALRYAPVAVVLGTVTQTISSQTYSEDVSLGVSVLYPVLQYQHEIDAYLNSPSGTDDNWKIVVRPRAHPLNPAAMAQIPGGATRTYKVCVRFMSRDSSSDQDPEHWIHTLKPYRHYFWTTYGNKAKYAQDLRPIHGRSMASCIYEYADDDNPNAFENVYWDGVPHWVDDDGWCFIVCRWQHYLKYTGRHERIMIWQPSGLYNFYTTPIPASGCHEPQPKPDTDSLCCWQPYPPQIMTGWIGEMGDTASKLLEIADTYAGDDPPGDPLVDLGYWWGYSSKYADAWPDHQLEGLDIRNGTHVAAALNEMDLAEDRGANTIGLDSLRHMDVWDALPWITKLCEDFPTLRFVGEPHCCDILHLYLPFVTSYLNLLLSPSGDDPHAPLLSDYLVPGRETWILFDSGDTGPYSDAAHASLLIGWGLTPGTFTCSPNMTEMSQYVRYAALNEIQWDWDEDPPRAPLSLTGYKISHTPICPYTGEEYLDWSSFSPADCINTPSNCELDAAECDAIASPIPPD